MENRCAKGYRKSSLLRALVCRCGLAAAAVCVLVIVAVMFEDEVPNPFLMYPVSDPIARVNETLAYTGPPQYSARELIKKFEISHRSAKTKVCLLSQFQEDKVLLEHLLGRVTGGFFVELGGYDGFAMSTSFFFERRMNWSGLLVEASPILAAEYYQQFAKLRPRVEYVNTAVCDTTKIVNYVIDFRCEACSGILDFFSLKTQSYYNRSCRAVDFKNYSKSGGSVRQRRGRSRCLTSPVPCIRVDELLRQRGVWKVDLFVLDVEGAEANVLRTVDLANGPPIHFFIVELDGKAEAKDRDVRRMLRAAGYVPRGRIYINEVWERVDFDAALRSYVRRVCGGRGAAADGGVCGGAGGVALYGPDADAEYHRLHTADCFRGDVAPASFYREDKWTPPFRRVEDAL